MDRVWHSCSSTRTKQHRDSNVTWRHTRSLQTLFYRLVASVLASLLKHKEKQCGKDHVRPKHKTHRRYQIWWVIWTEVHKPVRGTNHLDVTSDCKTINELKLNDAANKCLLCLQTQFVCHWATVFCKTLHNFSSLWVCGREFLECSTSVIKICWSQIFLPTASRRH